MFKKKIAILFSILSLGIFIGVYSLNVYRSYFFSIPIELINEYQVPCTSIEIENNKYLVEIDLGAKSALTLNKEVLDKVQKSPCGVSRKLNYLGNKYETPAYFISDVKVGAFLLEIVKASEESQPAAENSIIIPSKHCERKGRIGRDFFLDKNLFMDFSHKVFIACSQLKNLRIAGYEIDEMTPVPFKSTSAGIIFEIETDFGLGKFALDTGSTATVIRNTQQLHKNQVLPKISTSKFSIATAEFGPRNIYLLNISPALQEIDGFLGMDFLQEYAIYLDFTKKTAYIGKKAIKFP